MKIIEISDLQKIYPNGVNALKGIDLSVEEGDFFGLLGPNGAGKTTIIGILCSLVKKTAGNVQICGYDIDTHPEIAKQFLGIVPQEFNFNIFESCLQIIINQAGYYGISHSIAKPNAENLLHEFGLWEKRNTQAKELSGGLKRRLMVARSLINQPKILILDEPTAGVDISLRRTMWQFLTKLNHAGMTIILTTHYLEEAEALCKHISIINKGSIIENSATQSLLNRLNCETIIMYCAPFSELPQIPEISMRKMDSNTIEIDLYKGQTINDVVGRLAANGIIINRFKNKTNRLEELFVSLVEES